MRDAKWFPNGGNHSPRNTGSQAIGNHWEPQPENTLIYAQKVVPKSSGTTGNHSARTLVPCVPPTKGGTRNVLGFTPCLETGEGCCRLSHMSLQSLICPNCHTKYALIPVAPTVHGQPVRDDDQELVEARIMRNCLRIAEKDNLTQFTLGDLRMLAGASRAVSDPAIAHLIENHSLVEWGEPGRYVVNHPSVN